MTVVVSLPLDMTVHWVVARCSRRALDEACSLIGAEREVSSTVSSLDEESLAMSSSCALNGGFFSLRVLNAGFSSLRVPNGGFSPLRVLNVGFSPLRVLNAGFSSLRVPMLIPHKLKEQMRRTL